MPRWHAPAAQHDPLAFYAEAAQPPIAARQALRAMGMASWRPLGCGISSRPARGVDAFNVGFPSGQAGSAKQGIDGELLAFPAHAGRV